MASCPAARGMLVFAIVFEQQRGPAREGPDEYARKVETSGKETVKERMGESTCSTYSRSP